MGCCSSRAPGQHEWQANVPGSYKQNPIPQVKLAPSGRQPQLLFEGANEKYELDEEWVANLNLEDRFGLASEVAERRSAS